MGVDVAKETDNSSVPDSEHRGLAALLPVAARPFALLARLDRPIGWWLLLLPAWWAIPLGASTPPQMAYMLVLFLIGAVVMRGAGCVVNDLWDRRIDQRVERTRMRPLAAGTVTALPPTYPRLVIEAGPAGAGNRLPRRPCGGDKIPARR